MNKSDALILGLSVFAVSIALIGAFVAFGEIWPIPEGEYIDPVRAYYDDRNERARLQVDPEPIAYPMWWIDPLPETVQCGTWTPVTGHLPSEGGILSVFVMSENIIDDEYRHHYYRVNMSYQTDYNLQNYLNIPCNEETLGIYNITFEFFPHGFYGEIHTKYTIESNIVVTSP